MQLNNAIFILTIGTILEIIILIFMVVSVINFKVWAKKRDKVYSDKLDLFEKRIRIVEEHYWKELSETINETKKIVEKINSKFKL